jgi:hypothetical protein
MAVEANLNKTLYKIELYLLKVIPIIMALLSLANTTLFYFDIDATILTYLGGVSFLTIGFLYISSYVFRFCEYHRMFLHYIVLVNIISYIDLQYGIPLSDFNLLVLYTSIALVFIIIILYLKIKHERFLKKACNQIVKRDH